MRDNAPWGTWFHLVVTYDGSNSATGIKAYINGEEWPVFVRYNTAFTATMKNANSVWIGRNAAYWAGWQDEVSIWGKELSQAEVTELWNDGDPADLAVHSGVADLIGWWRMGEITYDGTARGMPYTSIGTDVPGGTFTTKSMTFDGLDDYVTMENVLGFDNTDAFSLSAWIKTTSTGIGTVIGKRDSTGRGYWLFLDAAGKIGFRHTNTETTNEIHVTTSGTYSDGSWKHVLVTYDGSQSAAGVVIYVNGSVAAQDAATADNLTATTANTAALMIGSREQVPRYRFLGTIDEVALYNTDLSGAEVTDVYNAGAPPDLKALSSAGTLTGWWRMGEGVLATSDEYFAFEGLWWLPSDSPPEYGP